MASWEPGRPIDALKSPRFTQIITFARLPFTRNLRDNNVLGVFLGVPFDGGATFYVGARFGPQYIRSESRILRPYNAELDVYPFKVLRAVDYGDVDVIPVSITKTLDGIEEVVKDVINQGATLFIAGGDHSITLGVLRAIGKMFKPILLHFDSHLDYWDEYWGEKYTHGTWVRRAIEEGLIAQVVQVGIRGTQYDKSDFNYPRESPVPIRVIMMREVEERGIEWLISELRSLEGNVYVSFDIDVVDPAYAPGTGTREPGGFTSNEVLRIIRSLADAKINLVGFDVVEVAPPLDVANITSLLAANILYQAMSVKSKLMLKNY
ncbi:agmatinase [Vulcanisaeta thermophila]|uniref:agmatinase n=1 Tax=Vulcanisaeta thermophila TaxID=867917 RepID=UPI000852C38D|nr:agmatinase [Vulcanisaeta thermophila]